MNRIHLIITVVLIAFLTSCKGKIHVNINGKVDSINGTKVRLTNEDFTVIYDSTIVRNNQFKFDSRVPKKGFYQIDFDASQMPFMMDNKNICGWLHPCLIYLESDAKNEFSAKNRNEILNNDYVIKSTSYNQRKFSEYNLMAQKERNRLKTLIARYKAKVENGQTTIEYAQNTDSITSMENRLPYVNSGIIKKFIIINPKTIITPYLASMMDDYFENSALYKKVSDGLAPEVKKSEYGIKLTRLLNAVGKVRNGAQIPPIVGNDLKGKAFAYNYHQKKYTLIDFWASWCIPCRKQNQQLKSIYKKYKGYGFDIIAVSIDSKEDWWRTSSIADSIPWYNVSECVKQKESKNKENFLANSIPLNYLIDNKGKIVARDMKLDSLKTFLEAKLK